VTDGATSALVSAELLHLSDPVLTLPQHLVPLQPKVVVDCLHQTSPTNHNLIATILTNDHQLEK
jgi:hypothetical protein